MLVPNESQATVGQWFAVGDTNVGGGAGGAAFESAAEPWGGAGGQVG